VAFMVVAVACLVMRLQASYPFDYTKHLIPSHLRLDSLFFGVLLAFYYHRYPDAFLSLARRFRFPLLVLGVVMLAPAYLRNIDMGHNIYIYGFTLFYLGSGCLLVAALGFQGPPNRLTNAVAYIGSHSYSLYLWHMAVNAWGLFVLAKLFPQGHNWFIYAAVYLIGSVVVGIGMATLIEFPVLRLRDRIFPSRGRPLSVGAVVSPETPVSTERTDGSASM